MSVRSRFRRFSFTFFFLTTNKFKLVFGVLTLALASFTCRAQEPSSASGALSAAPNSPAIENSMIVPAGTNIALVLTHPVRSKTMHKGDDIYAQVMAPVTVGDAVAIPPGAFMQGKVDKLQRNGGRGELHLQSMTLTLPDGEVIPFAGPVTWRVRTATLWRMRPPAAAPPFFFCHWLARDWAH
ncbi:MAG TPA: hypothetical protein VN754_14715 [Candidatus Binataceae bacterium]|nr:hypothetical protein [Candidatus Binataceae bacterium]